jgi:light-regulated signal transduction histidine kinase (bacteriophytochrome)
MPDLAAPDLTACDREPIHIPGAIQPHGVLLALDGEMRVRRAAGLLGPLLGFDGDPIGKPVAELVDLESIPLPKDAAQAEFAATIKAATGTVDVFAHRSGDELIVEFERAPGVRRTAAEVLRDMLPMVERTLAAPDIVSAANAAATGVAAITGYDRVMIYRFLDDGSGQVIAEARAAGIEPFLHHRYPASDIPQQARALYVRNPIRLIPDVAYAPAPVIGGEGPLDLSGALLRSVSPVHIQYLKNMQVGASASISLVRDDRLWGLIACHHRTPCEIHHEQREMCRRIAIALQHSANRLDEENTHREALRLTRRREELLPLIAAAETVPAGIRANIDDLRRLVSADGIAVLLGAEILANGITPPEAPTAALARWVVDEAAPDQLVTNHLAAVYPRAAEWTASASGLLACIVSRAPLTAILWFRAEEVETVNWAGNPHKPAEPGSAPGQLTPRRSFELWAETVRGRSRSWRPSEQDAARRVASGLAEIARHKTLAELNRQLTGEVAEKDLLMREVHHRVQNSLQLVTSMLQLQEKEVGEANAEDQLQMARDRVLSVALLHRRLWRSEDLQNINLETFFGELLEGLISTWREDWRGQVSLDVVAVRAPAHEALIIALIVSELLTNAVKHAYGGAAGPISVTATEAGNGRLAIAIADKGVGTTGESRPGSFGSRLVQRLVASIHGELTIAPNSPGTAITLTVPLAGAL